MVYWFQRLEPEDEIWMEFTHAVGGAIVVGDDDAVERFVGFAEHPPIVAVEEMVGLLQVAFQLADEVNFAGDGDDVAHVVNAFVLREQERQVVVGGQVLDDEGGWTVGFGG